jgi:uncharacterized protein HemY
MQQAKKSHSSHSGMSVEHNENYLLKACGDMIDEDKRDKLFKVHLGALMRRSGEWNKSERSLRFLQKTNQNGQNPD